MIRTKGEAGTGNVVEAVRHIRAINRDIKAAQGLDPSGTILPLQFGFCTFVA